MSFQHDVEIPFPSESPTPEVEATDVEGPMQNFNNKLKKILSCIICLELRRSSMYQCKQGHLICIGCFVDIIAESNLHNEIASCPQCQSTIRKDSYAQNIAVEKAISELPRKCHACDEEILPESYSQHQKIFCDKRPAICSNSSIGCNWKGTHHEKHEHEQGCKQLSASGEEILKSLVVMDEEVKKEASHYEQVFELFSAESFLHFDLQFKMQLQTVESNSVTSYFESSKFSAFQNSFLLQAYFQEEIPEFGYRLVLKSECKNKPLSFQYLLVKGPFSDLEIKPRLCQFTYDEKAPKIPFKKLKLCNKDDYKNYFFAKRINFRIFVFLK